VRARTAFLLLGALLCGCPLPQPIPETGKSGPITPPRVVADDTIQAVRLPQTVVEVPAGCSTAPSYVLGAPLRDPNTTEPVVARWFVNYDPRQLPNPSVVVQQEDDIPAPDASADEPTLRQTPTFTFAPYAWSTASGTGGGDGSVEGALHVVELVVSNGFDTAFDLSTAARPFRKPLLNFEVQVFRWVFLTVAPSSDAPCPP